MDSKFLDNIQVAGNPLSQEIKQIILEEHSRGIEKIKAKYSDYDAIKEQLAAANKQIEDFKGMDIDGVKKAAEEWKAKAEQAERDAAERIAEMEFQSDFSNEFMLRKGRSKGAIEGALGKEKMDELRKSKDRKESIKSAFDDLVKESGYLFESETPPPFSAGAGNYNLSGDTKMAAIRAAAGLKGE